VRGDARSLFNYLVPMVQDERAGEEREEGGNRPSQIGQAKGVTQGQPGGASRNSLAALSRALYTSRKVSRASDLIVRPGVRLSWHAREYCCKLPQAIAGGFIGRQPVTL